MPLVKDSTSEEQIKWDKQIREQKELQLLESRIRQATAGTLHHAGINSHAADNALYEERLREYQDLASRYDAEFKDTVEEAEANGGVVEGGMDDYV